MLRKGTTPTSSHNNLSDDDYDPISTHSYGHSSKASAGGACGGGGGASCSSSKNEEDRHRRTIIIEKRNNSYGFTLQSYGIHYKREQELEMLTYVDHVEYDGPAYKAGMREGDVILSINGVDMEKADHSSLVAFIKECDTRMRMVVLFEDCVRKVSLHMRYIQLQNLLQNKVTELEALLQREREILEGKWKTHSLPARKKASQNVVDKTGDSASNYVDDIYPNGGTAGGASAAVGGGAGGENSRRALASKTNTLPITRTAVSTENIGKIGSVGGVHGIENFTPNAQVLLSYQYMDPTSRSNLKSSNSSGIDSTDYLGRDGEDENGSNEGLNYYSLKSQATNKSDPNLHQQQQPRSNCSTLSRDQKRQGTENPHQSRHSQYYSNLQENIEKPNGSNHGTAQKEHSFGSRCRQSYYCNPCMGGGGGGGSGGGDKKGSQDPQNNGDNVSLEAYDLAGSPSMCCDPHQCVPIRRRRSKHHHHNHNHNHPPQQQAQGQVNHHHHSKENVNQPQQPQQQPQQETQHKCHHHHHQKHKHKHGGKCEEEQKQRPQRPKSQSNLPSNPTAAMIQYQKTQQLQQNSTRFYDMQAVERGASRCSLHSCSHNDCCPSTTGSYCTSLSADTLNDWQDQSGDCLATPNHSGKGVKVIVHGQGGVQGGGGGGGQFITQQQYQGNHQPHSQFVTRFYHHTVQIQPTPDYQYQQNFIQKQKSWDNLSGKTVTGGGGTGQGGFAYGYEYVGQPGTGQLSKGHQFVQMEPHSMCGYRVHPQQQPQSICTSNSNSANRKPVYQHYGMKGAAAEVANSFSSMPCQHVHPAQPQGQPLQQQTTTSTTIITSTTTHNSKTLENGGGVGGNPGLMMTKCIKGELCTASGCAGNAVSGGCQTGNVVAKK